MHALQNQITQSNSPDLSLNGINGYSILNNRIILNIGEIANNRPSDNVSGTLSLELWALKQAYQGGGFSGVSVAGITMGELQGQHVISQATWDLDFQEPAAGSWQLTLMLREWNGTAYETRDFVNFAVPYTVTEKAEQVRYDANNVISVSFVEQKRATLVDAQSGKLINNEYVIQSQTIKPAPTELVLQGNCGYDLQNDRITLSVAEITNLRPADDMSGTLSLELWALPQAYQGGYFDGFPLAGVRIGELQGRHSLLDLNLSADFQTPPAGTWILTLMLREWTGVAYETRDCINFADPYTVKPDTDMTHKDLENVINVNFGEPKKPVAVAQEPTAIEDVDVTSRGSINQITLDELTALKGVPKKTVQNIVAAQPFSTIDDLSNVKGVGPKLLKILRELFSL